MFLKLVKHELHETLRMLLPVYGGLLLFAAVTRAMIWLMEQNENSILQVMGGLVIGLFVLACIASVILTAVLLMIRFGKSVHGDEGYLTHTLPVGVHSILLSRLLITVLSLLASLGVAYLSIRLSIWNVRAVSEILEGIGEIFGSIGMDSSFRWMTLASIFVQLLSTALMIFAAISIGHSFNRGKAGFSILFYFAMNTTVSLISTLIALVLMPRIFDETANAGVFTNQYYVFAIILNLVFCGVFYFVTWLMTKKRLNLS